MSNKDNLQRAKAVKDDEFYTRYEDIENELQHYEEELRGKVIYCNCDSLESNFVKYFMANGARLGIKKLVYTSDDFRTNTKLLAECDIVITNPPFSLFNEFYKLIKQKDFIFIAPMNILTYKMVLNDFMKNKISSGINSVKEFIKEDGSIQKFGNICWFTNMDNDKVVKPLDLTAKFNRMIHPMYDNHDAINIDRVKDIPKIFHGNMGVPITFLEKHNRDQFDIIGEGRGEGNKHLRVNDKKKFTRIIIRHKRKYTGCVSFP